MTPNGIAIQTNGFDYLQASDLPPSQFTYINLYANQFPIRLGLKNLVALHNLENRMKVPLTSNPPVIAVDQRVLRVDPQEIEKVLDLVRDAVLRYFPAGESIDIHKCEIVIEPTIFYVVNSNFGNTWAGGLTKRLDGGKYRIHVILFYINSQGEVYDWRDFLVHEVINFYVMELGREDLVL